MTKIDDKTLLLGMDSKEVSNYIYNLLLNRIDHNHDILLPKSLSFIPFYSEASYIPPFFKYTMSQYIGFNNIINSNSCNISKDDGKAYMMINLNDENGVLYNRVQTDIYLDDLYRCAAERLILLRELKPEERIFIRSNNILSLHNILICKNEETFNILQTEQFKFTNNQYNDYYQTYKIHFTDERVIFIDPEETFDRNDIKYPLARYIVYPEPAGSKICKFCGNQFLVYNYNKNQEYCNLYCYPETITNTDNSVDIQSKFYKTYHTQINPIKSNEFFQLSSRDSILKEIKSLGYSLSNIYNKYKPLGDITLDDILYHLLCYGLWVIDDTEQHNLSEEQYKYLYNKINQLNDFNRVRLYKHIS